MFEIIDEKSKQIVVSVHLEQIYTVLKKATRLKERNQLFKEERWNIECVEDLFHRIFESKQYQDYQIVIDFSHVRYIYSNGISRWISWLEKNINRVQVCHHEAFWLCNGIGEIKGLRPSESLDYREKFNCYVNHYIKNKCCDKAGYNTQTGTRLDVYIDVKKIINENVEILRWCYIIAYDLDAEFTSRGETMTERNMLFCHTLNGSYIAGVLSQLLGLNLIYVDHLGPYNKLNRADFYRNDSRAGKFIIVADMICQGNEFLRAKNIVEYLGGSVRGCAGILKLEISKRLLQNKIQAFAISYEPNEARTELGYTISTPLCAGNCTGSK